MPLSKKIAPVRALVLMAKAAQAHGCTVTESRPYAVVNRVHAPGSWHYDLGGYQGRSYSLAIDINHPAGGSREFEELAALGKIARNLGVSYIHATQGTAGAASTHRTHGHADCGEWSSLGAGDFRTQARNITAAGLQDDTNARIDNDWGPITDKHLEAVRAASKLGGEKFPHGVKFAQQAVGARPDGDWGARSRRSHDEAVRRIQHTLRDAGLYHGRIDSIWGPGTDGGYKAARKEFGR